METVQILYTSRLLLLGALPFLLRLQITLAPTALARCHPEADGINAIMMLSAIRHGAATLTGQPKQSGRAGNEGAGTTGAGSATPDALATPQAAPIPKGAPDANRQRGISSP